MVSDPFVPISMPDISGNEKKYVNQCVDTGWVSSIGEFVVRFENDFARYCGMEYSVTVNSGTAALHLALRALGIKEGDEVIVPALTFAATANAVLYLGAVPVFADNSPDCWNIDPQEIERCITPRTKAVIPVHLYGLPCQMDEIMAIAERHKIFVIEDCAEAHGATFDGKRVGCFGHISCFSFYGNKVITTGEGGACVTNSVEYNERMRFLRDHGMSKEKRYWHGDVGYNYRMTNLQAAIGCAQLERIEEFIDKKRALAAKYNELLGDLPLILPGNRQEASSVFWLYTLLLSEDYGEKERDQLIDFLAARNIDSRPVFYSMPCMPPYASFGGPLPNADSMSSRGISLPSHHEVTEDVIERICAHIRQWFAS